jgi:hypothetical protein
METKIYSGKIEERDHFEAPDIVFLSGMAEPLACELGWMNGKQVCVSYWITDKQVTKPEAREAFMLRLMGAADVDFFSHYSEITGYLWTDEDLCVGGHDLIGEFKENIGKWLILEVEDVTPSAEATRQNEGE